MKEELLHFVWKYKKLPLNELRTSQKEPVTVLEWGTYNDLAGPDFFNAKIRIQGQLWAGNVEIHLKSSDWYRHHHEQDSRYNNVILHVVWEDDVPVLRNDGTLVPTLVLKDYISPTLLKSYQQLLNRDQNSFINCELHLKEIDVFTWDHWLERLYFERLEQKSALIVQVLHNTQNDWERVFYMLLLKNFGLNINGDAFYALGQALDFEVVRKLRHDVFQLESLFFGTVGFLADTSIPDTYYLNLQKEYAFLKHTYGISRQSVPKPEFFKLRPANFPTVRLSQFANLMVAKPDLFSGIIQAKSLNDLYLLFSVGPSPYWETHYTFGALSKKSTKKLSKKFIDSIIINTIIPLKFCFAQHKGADPNEEIISLISLVPKEDNALIRNYERLGIGLSNAMNSQSLLTLYKEYCSQNKCVQCAVGRAILS